MRAISFGLAGEACDTLEIARRQVDWLDLSQVSEVSRNLSVVPAERRRDLG